MPACSKLLVKRQAQGPAQTKEQGTPPEPDRAGDKPQEDKPQEDGPASVLSIDLRRALVPASPGIMAPTREVTPVPRAADRITAAPQPQGQGMAGPFIAALVAVSIAGGVFYIFETDRFGMKPVADEPAAASAESAPSDDAVRSAEVSQPPEQ